jgi:hypothetical protein
MIDSNINFQYIQEVCIMSTQYKNIDEIRTVKERIPLSSKVKLTKEQLKKSGLESLYAYATRSPEEQLGKFLDL